MRLIDADKLYLHLNNWAFAEAPNDFDVGDVKFERDVIYKTICDCMKAIDEQPTAYDVDWVVDELYRCETTVEDIIDKDDCIYPLDWYKGALYAYKDAINIVGRGGTDND